MSKYSFKILSLVTCVVSTNSIFCVFQAELLGEGLVKREKQNGKLIVKPVTSLPNVIELSYYSNGLLSHFAIEAALGL